MQPPGCSDLSPPTSAGLRELSSPLTLSALHCLPRVTLPLVRILPLGAFHDTISESELATLLSLWHLEGYCHVGDA